ncbi:hypothetical protein C5Y96_21275 [Blastopirellula marina]|uniref:Uncharacterized protein n=1 Tax=Blastopirellula marina TaxID=124 RepID=A0A2S8F1C8_9BACT|nr:MULTISPECIES: hypothetical protein [Pirellulaceae]PQO25985.1 hypothetical protein C5Y96_21275 [Blastopirellula marina]RCS44343.1 hypothetical protein DTL36_21320 [Bremerella cremea]
MNDTQKRWQLLIIANIVCLAGGWWYSQGHAAPPETKQPFANAVQQRESMIRLLQESNQLLREQNMLLKSGKLKVQVTESK